MLADGVHAARDAAAEDAVTDLIGLWREGDPKAFGELIRIVYSELRRIAGWHMQREGRGRTMQPTAVVHEVVIKLMGQRRIEWRDRKKFLSFASELMRRLLVDHARRRTAAKRGGAWHRVELNETLATISSHEEVLQLNLALQALEAVADRPAQVVNLKFFMGFTNRNIAEVLGVGLTTVKEDWEYARRWLARHLQSPNDEPKGECG